MGELDLEPFKEALESQTIGHGMPPDIIYIDIGVLRSFIAEIERLREIEYAYLDLCR